MNKKEKIDQVFEEYVQLRYSGVDHDTAMKTFDYMHPVQYARLEKRVRENFPTDVDKSVGNVDNLKNESAS